MTDSDSTQRNPARYSDACGGIVLFIASAGIVGWFFDIGFLKSVLPGGVVMKFNTALGLLLGGIALLGASRRHSFGWRVARSVCAILIACLGALTLTEYFFGWDVGFDNLVFREGAGAVGTSHPGRMSPHTAACLLLIGLAFFFYSSPGRWQRILSRTLISGVAFIALAVLAGHLYGALYFYGVSHFTGMAIHSALAFLVLGAGLFCAQHEAGRPAVFFSDTTGGLTARRLLPAAVLLPLLLGWLMMRGQYAGFYDSATGLAILITSIIFVFVVLIGFTARRIHRLDLSRREALEARERTIQELQRALDEVHTLQGLLPMCAWCKKVRDDSGYWGDVASYITAHTDAEVSHGICPECAKLHLTKSNVS
jgi:hypothetical protein